LASCPFLGFKTFDVLRAPCPRVGTNIFTVINKTKARMNGLNPKGYLDRIPTSLFEKNLLESFVRKIVPTKLV
jgi:hypothetical protein